AGEPISRRAAALGAGLALAGAVYMTLLPFEFADLSLEQAWAAYSAIRLDTPIDADRVQWAANILLFLPLGFFWAAWLTHGVGGRAARGLLALAAVLVSLAATCAVEFLQVWLPYRQPAIADMSGNLLGGALGAAAWLALRPHLGAWLRTLRGGGLPALRLALLAYALVYVALGQL
ncbi:VanZ family protein, partial [Halorhodospira neutriphila]